MPTEISNRFLSKDDFMKYFKDHCKSIVSRWLLFLVQYYMLSDSYVNRDYMRDILAGRKSLFKINDVRWINVPKYDELSVKNLFPRLKDDEKFMKYLPDTYPAGR